MLFPETVNLWTVAFSLSSGHKTGGTVDSGDKGKLLGGRILPLLHQAHDYLLPSPCLWQDGVDVHGNQRASPHPSGSLGQASVHPF